MCSPKYIIKIEKYTKRARTHEAWNLSTKLQYNFVRAAKWLLITMTCSYMWCNTHVNKWLPYNSDNKLISAFCQKCNAKISRLHVNSPLYTTRRSHTLTSTRTTNFIVFFLHYFPSNGLCTILCSFSFFCSPLFRDSAKCICRL